MSRAPLIVALILGAVLAPITIEMRPLVPERVQPPMRLSGVLSNPNADN